MKTPPVIVPAFVQEMLMKHLQKRLINPAAFEDAEYSATLQQAFNHYSEANCHALAASLLPRDTWNVPTFVRVRTQEPADSEEYLSDPAIPYISPETGYFMSGSRMFEHKYNATFDLFSFIPSAIDPNVSVNKIRRWQNKMPFGITEPD